MNDRSRTLGVYEELHVFPMLTVRNQMNCLKRYVIRSRNVRLFLSVAKSVLDRGNLRLCQFSGTVLTTSRIVRTSLAATITIIVKHCPKKQMCRIHAERLITLMQDAESHRDQTIRQRPRNAMCSLLASVKPKSPIGTTRSEPCTSPQPAMIVASLVNSFPESTRDIWVREGRHTWRTLA